MQESGVGGGDAKAAASSSSSSKAKQGSNGSQSLNATSSMGGDEQTISYSAERIIGHGSFGVVFQVRRTTEGAGGSGGAASSSCLMTRLRPSELFDRLTAVCGRLAGCA